MTSLASTLSRLAAAGNLRTAWSYLRELPGGGRLMGALIGRLAPYTGSIHPEVLHLEPGRARIRMADRRALRNHLDSVHAVALMNLGEVATGTAMLVSLPVDARAIVKSLTMEYLKKARGDITAECICPIVQSSERKEHLVVAELTNAAGELVAKAQASWLVGPQRSS